MTGRVAIRLGMDVLALAAFAAAGLAALEFSRLARHLPLFVSVAGAALAAASLVRDVLSVRRDGGRSLRFGEAEGAAEEAERPIPARETLRHLAWIAGFAALIWIASLPVAVALFLAAFLRVEGGVGARGILLGVAAVEALLFGLTELMTLRWPPSLIDWSGVCGNQAETSPFLPSRSDTGR